MDNILLIPLVIGVLLLFAAIIARDLLSGILLLVFFLPFERLPSIEMASYTLKINHIVGGLLIIFWILERFVFRKKGFARNPISLLLFLFLSALLLSGGVADLKSRAIVFILLSFFTLILSVITIDVVRTAADFKKVEKVLLLSSWVVVIFSAWQFLGDVIGLPLWATGLIEGYSKATFGFPRIQAFSKEPLYLGNYLLLPMALAVSRLIRSKKALIIDWVLVLSLLIVFFLTLSRGALLGLASFGLVLCLFYPRKIFTPKIILTSLAVIGISFGLVIVGINSLGENTKDRFLQHLVIQDLNQSESTVSRLSEGQIALNDWREHPWFGVGMGNYGGSKTNYDIYDPKTQDIVNNEYLELLAETGVFGLGTFILLITAIITRSLKIFRSPQLKGELVDITLMVGLTAAFIGMLVQYAFFSTLSIIHIWVTLGLLVVVQNIVINRGKAE